MNQADTLVDVTVSKAASVFGEKVEFTATVTVVAPGNGTPAGEVIFKAGGIEIGRSPLSSGTTTYETDVLAADRYTITAEYVGDASFKPSSGTAPLAVSKADTVIAVTSSVTNSVYGKNVTFTAIVTAVALGSGTPEGSVTFMNGTVELGEVTLAGGTAKLAVVLAPGEHTITALYEGSSSYMPSTGAVDQLVDRKDSVVTVNTSNAASVYGESIILTAKVQAVDGKYGVPKR